MSGSGKKPTNRSNNEKIVIGNLMVLTSANAIWVTTSASQGPYVGLLMYALVTYSLLGKRGFQRGGDFGDCWSRRSPILIDFYGNRNIYGIRAGINGYRSRLTDTTDIF